MPSEQKENIVIIEESDAANPDAVKEESTEKKKRSPKKKKKTIIFQAIGGVVFVLLIIILVLVLKSPEAEDATSTQVIEKKLEKKEIEHIEPTKLEKLIAKANYLYTSGSKEQALALYEKIAIYAEAISQYNLGVAQLKDGQYEKALQTFQVAINNDEKRCVSAINAAVCALHLNKKESFKYYIDLAYAYLPYETQSPLYSYYYTLINYYNNNYLEALSSINNATTKEYPDIQKHISAKINVLFNNNYKAIEALDTNYEEIDSFSMALLYARIGDLTLARKYFQETITRERYPLKAKLGLALINLKAGRISTASTQIKEVSNKFEQEVYKPFPIKVTLKDSIFNPKKAQYYYRNSIANNKLLNYQKIFYFAPYKLFNADQTISYIRKGNANIFIDNINSAQMYLKKSASSSTVNKGITNAIKLALSFKVTQANELLKKLVKIQPKHSILRYNLALTYAQLGNMTEAHKNFLRSYHLNAKNYLSAVFAIMTSQLINKENKKLKSIIIDSLENEKKSQEIKLCQTLLSLSQNDLLAINDWLENNYERKPLYLALDVIIALKIGNTKVAKKAAQKLTILLPNEILPHLMYIDTAFSNLNEEDYASSVLNYLKKQKFHFNDLYYGPVITSNLYIKQSLITGKIFYLVKQIKDVLESTDENTKELTSSLALASLYNKNFEESYLLYNELIDNLKVRDANTLFLGAVASTAAGHHENAIALLELSKMKNRNFLESRFALGLLYMQIKNNEGATIQFSNMKTDGFSSNYFNFEIDTDKLLFEKNKK